LRYENALRIAEQRTRRTHPATPNEADPAALAEAHAELLKTPQAHRERPTELLIKQAAECGHLSAVLDLLSQLPSPRDFNGRPSSAFSALWRAATGQDVAPCDTRLTLTRHLSPAAAPGAGERLRHGAVGHPSDTAAAARCG
jgi:hypothetical protein